MTPPPFALPHAPIFWAVYLWAFLPELLILRRAGQRVTTAGSQDRSIRVMTAGMSAALVFAFPLAFLDAWSFRPELHTPAFIIGVLLIFLGSLIRRWCFRTLGEYFTGDIQARPGQPVIRTGPYDFVRHPSYTGGMLMYLGIGLALCNWLSVAVLVLTGVATYAYRVRAEERLLLGTLGEPYRVYMRERKRFIPYVL
ncbi:MAG TPA: isoprenylcysteine carboxylmethyltransferase family protein [Gemmatimonadaceae bacterium]|nr:isoprenylcysteine carboxylmethyltransferase family protein [Gemmatimonadaceae bacterium]